ncbi:TrkH family potassium uptake protein [Salipaludibacillus sp. LMS25]|jgi:trk system potassium uptake protein TrkH|uniref:TrkH family potassium uptake protein n=1 Tax=Salipaludibacillus sp. LMS25 TaxID=2924031 RepID=UPI0020D17997|nr:TrkH family potassium uptake protein [Salipaludibacillus sp. LMS25]UTR13296.1 TrkH family potassium uptake protein [Salipaludibacillus sp. LMS25]
MKLSSVKQKKISPPRVLAVGFLVTIVIGTLLLMLPFATKEGITLIDALFTATSATTVTGLIVVDTGSAFTFFGQIVIMLLIKVGGLGLMTFAILIVLALGKRIGLRERLLVQESLNQTSLGGMIRLVKVLLIFAFSMEAIATLFLSFHWIPKYGWGFGFFTSLFHSISAFNNAGFSLWRDSLSGYVGDPVVNIIITFLFITGGIGFTVVYDLFRTKTFRQLSLHTKLMLVGTLVVNIVAMFLMFVLEYGNPDTLGSLTGSEKLWASYFQAVTPRTAGFNTVDIGSLTPGTITFMLVLMFIGAGSASTGSGIKLTTFIIIVLAISSYLRARKETVVFERRIDNHIVIRALSIVGVSLTAVFISVFLLSVTETAPYLALVFEAFSAFGTVGLSMGITDELTFMGKQVIIVLMVIGRIGPVTLAFALAKSETAHVRYPKGDVFTG